MKPTKESFFVPENANLEDRTEHTSPSGRWKLVITPYKTRKGAWNYSRGEVFDTSNRAIVADVHRNYRAFPFTWIEDHRNGHSYIVCGEDYQGQTVIELDTIRRRDHLPPEAKDGNGFCWSSSEILEDGCTLLVDGCYWACSYEYRLFDFSNPMERGWPEVKPPPGTDLFSTDGFKPRCDHGLLIWEGGERVFKATGERESSIESKYHEITTLIRKEMRDRGDQVNWDAVYNNERVKQHNETYPDEDEDADKWEIVIDHRIVLRREDDAMVLVSEWKSDRLVEQEKKMQKWQEKWDEDSRTWQANDVRYVWLAGKLGGISEIRKRTHIWIPSQNDREEGDTNPAYFSVGIGESGAEKTARIDWGVRNGEIRVEMWERGKGGVEKKEFPRENGIEDAWKAAMDHIGA